VKLKAPGIVAKPPPYAEKISIVDPRNKLRLKPGLFEAMDAMYGTDKYRGMPAPKKMKYVPFLPM
jgi:hypothetical protein